MTENAKGIFVEGGWTAAGGEAFYTTEHSVYLP